MDQVTDDGPVPDDYCTHCDSRLVEDEWHPVVADRDDSTVVALHSFCDDDCVTAWSDDD